MSCAVLQVLLLLVITIPFTNQTQVYTECRDIRKIAMKVHTKSN